MTREEIIKWLESLKAEIGKSEHRALWHYAEAIDMAIEALRAEGAQGVGRYENAMQKLREMPKYLNSIKEKQIKKISDDAVKGEWIKTVSGNGWNEWSVLKCPLCGVIIEDKQYHSWGYNYCPNCGKRIKGGDIE